jgi:ABC-type transport system involved in multi-copper enzyme maturation permease subunit
VTLATLLVGHLAGIECRRALARGWLIVVRGLLALALGSVLWLLIWVWWLTVRFDPTYVPTFQLRFAIDSAAMIMLTIVVVQVPAVLAGSLAGERERGVLQLLLTTAVSPREIVSGRLLGKLSQVGMILLAGLPLLAILFAWNGFGFVDLLVMLVLLAAVGFGAGGLAVGASVISRRGRDALLSVYILMLLLLMSPLLSWVGLPVAAAQWLLWFNPFFCLNHLVFDGGAAPVVAASAFWVAVGLAGSVVAGWRMRPTCLGTGDAVKKSRRNLWVPPLGDRPMLWKELHIERAGTLGRFGRWLGVLLTLSIGGGSLVLAAIILVDVFWRQAADWSVGATNFLAVLLSGASATFMGWLLQWAVGLRASVSIASERERGTWDALLMSPLEPGEIVRAKLFGSLHALRWIVGAMVLAWTVGVSFGAVNPRAYFTWLADSAATACLMAAVGVRCSLSLPTATKAMTWTIAMWMVSLAGVATLAFAIICGVWLLVFALWMTAVSYAYIPPTTPVWALPMSWSTAWPLTTGLVTLLITFLLVLDTSLRFDRIAGRMAGGKVATTVDQWLRGGQMQPVFLPAKTRSKPVRSAEPLAQLAEPVASMDAVAVD